MIERPIMCKVTVIISILILNCIDKLNGENNELNRKNPQILIIGAGAAGIAAASKLFENGFTNVIILEAENRIGGRVYTTKLGNYSVDLGGQWVHGEKGNVAFELASPFGLLDKTSELKIKLEQELFDSLGNFISSDIEESISTFFVKYFLEEDIDSDTVFESMGEYADKMFDNYFKNNSVILKDKKKYMQNLELMVESWDAAESWYQISAAGKDEFKECEGDQSINWKTRGYSTILDILMKRYPDPKRELPVTKNTILNSEVMSIDYLHSGEGPPILVSTTKGHLYKADHVIVTVSLGVLKEKHDSLFIPPLPKNKVKTIEALAFGNAAKIYLLFEKPFWDLKNKSYMHYAFIWNEAEKKSVENDPEKMWQLGITGALTVEHKPDLLELWISGKYAKAMEELPEEKVFNQTVEILHQFLDKTYNVSQPIALLRTQWYTNPHFRGTYSFRSVETEKLRMFPDTLEEPLEKNLTVLFAGEATSKHRFSTVDGAIGSGWKAANRLIDYYKHNSTIVNQ